MFIIHRAPVIRYEQGAHLHTAANDYRCSDPTCPCSTSGQVEPPAITPTLLFAGPCSCAWCNDEAGIPQGSGSHGICERHAAEMMARAKARRAARRQGGAL